MKEVVGEIRKGQLITMFGVGSFVDLPHLSVVVRGLNSWPQQACQEIVEPRLLSVVKAKVPSVSKIRMCPDKSSDEPERLKIDPNGIPVSVFPRWLRCPLCNVMSTVNSGVFQIEYPPYQVDKIRFIHKGCTRAGHTNDRQMPGAGASRFLVACLRGHVSDFPWIEFCHRGQSCGAPTLVLRDEGVTGEAAEVQVCCLSCNAWRPMADAFGVKAELGISKCPGNHPHLGVQEECDEKEVKAILLGASNLYFPVTVSVLALPEKEKITDLDTIVQEHFERFEVVQSEADAAMIIKFGGILELTDCQPAELWAALQKAREGGGSERLAEVREEEYAVLARTAESFRSERMSVTLHTDLPDYLSLYLERISLVDTLIEVSALVGFTRLETAGDLSDYDMIEPERLAPLMRTPISWVPGAENRGEGVFLKIREDALRAWERRPQIQQRMEEHLAAYHAFKKERPWMKIEAPQARYILLHTLSHLLVRELAITCGYASTSLRERIYSLPEESETDSMSGLLLYTASPDSEGTLGGLVALGNPVRFEAILKSALERARVCSSDPICSHYEIAKGSKLHGASCHSCSFAAETSCERANRFLDRAFLVDTFATTDCSFFGETS